MLFLHRLAPLLRRQEIADGITRALLGGVRALALSLPTMLVIGILVAVMVKRPILITVIPTTFVAALVTIAYHAGGFDSLLALVLAPTGIPSTMEYVNFVASLRMLIERRS
jgi:hypothetical protein